MIVWRAVSPFLRLSTHISVWRHHGVYTLFLVLSAHSIYSIVFLFFSANRRKNIYINKTIENRNVLLKRIERKFSHFCLLLCVLVFIIIFPKTWWCLEAYASTRAHTNQHIHTQFALCKTKHISTFVHTIFSLSLSLSLSMCLNLIFLVVFA